MIVFVVLHHFKCTIEKPNGEHDTLEYDMLEAIKLSQAKAQEFINQQPPEIQKRLRIEHWNAE